MCSENIELPKKTIISNINLFINFMKKNNLFSGSRTKGATKWTCTKSGNSCTHQRILTKSGKIIPTSNSKQ